MICMTSRTGDTTFMKRSLRPARTPSGIPIRSDRVTAAEMSASVWMVASHSPSRPNATKLPRTRRAVRQVTKARPRAVKTAVMPIQLMPPKTIWKPSTRALITWRIGSKT